MADNNEEVWFEACKRAEARCENQAQTISELRYAGNELSRVMEDILGSGMITCQISKSVMIATVARWKEARYGR